MQRVANPMRDLLGAGAPAVVRAILDAPLALRLRVENRAPRWPPASR